jgi:hypothetical protein
MVNEALVRRSAASAPRGGSDRLALNGVKRGDWRARPEARKLALRLAERGEIAYWVTTAETKATSPHRTEQRGGAREKTRLRSAKLLTAAYRFICECRICDLSLNGLQLALTRNIGLPLRMAVHIDETGEVRHAKVVWRRGPIVGVRLYEAAPAGALRPSDRLALKERYYAVRNW